MKKITGGVYLVVDPTLGFDFIIPTLEKAISGGVDVLQIWNNWKQEQNKTDLVEAICNLAHKAGIPVLINEDWQLLETTNLDGVHFDQIPHNLVSIKQGLGRPFICGLTLGNDLDRLTWANDNALDYVSFCSMFPTGSANSCVLVKKETVRKARQMTSLPIFLAGGITLSTIEEVLNTGLDGVAVISAIMTAKNPKQVTESFKQKIINGKKAV